MTGSSIHVASEREVQRVVDFLSSCSTSEHALTNLPFSSSTRTSQADWHFGGFPRDYPGGVAGEWGGPGDQPLPGPSARLDEQARHSNAHLGRPPRPTAGESLRERRTVEGYGTRDKGKELHFNFSNGFGPLISSEPPQPYTGEPYQTGHLMGLGLFTDSDSEHSG